MTNKAELFEKLVNSTKELNELNLKKIELYKQLARGYEQQAFFAKHKHKLKHTREDYLAKKVSHHDYYLQFCGEEVRQWVLNNIGMDKLRKCTDTVYLSDLPCSLYWDKFYSDEYFNMISLTARAFKVDIMMGSDSDAVSMVKAQARQMLIEEGLINDKH